jgi:ferredoxin--NADP+ reductase
MHTETKLRTAPIDAHHWVRGQVVDNRHWSPQIYSLRVAAHIEPFQAGQFGRLGLMVNGEFVSRPYSFVSSPSEEYLEFYGIAASETSFARHLHALQPRQDVWVARKAAGSFTLAKVPEDGEDLWLFATGTALAPFLSILKTPEPWKRFARIVLVHSVRTAAELVYGELISGFEDTHPGQFTIVPFVSREDHASAIRGRITAGLTGGALEDRVGFDLDPSRAQAMLCGNPEMVRDTTDVLLDRGFRENRPEQPGNITIERYC